MHCKSTPSANRVEKLPDECRLGYEDFSPPSSPSGSEFEDEADEDSNDEDFYRNDYPEDEDADSDMEDLVERDELWSEDEQDAGSGDDEGGMWDYR